MASDRQQLLPPTGNDNPREDEEISKLVKSDSVLYMRTSVPFLPARYNTFLFPKHSGERDVTERHPAAPVGLKWFVIVACLICVLLSMGVAYSLSILYAQLIRVFDTDRSLVALNQSFYEALLAVGGALWSYPVTKLGYGYCVILGGIAGSICIGASAFATNVPTIIVLIGIFSGAAFGILYMAPFVVAGDVFNKYKEAVIGFVSIGASVGQFSLSFLLEVSIEAYQWNGAMLILGAVCLNSIPCGILIVFLQRYSEDKAVETQAAAKRSLFKLSLFKEKLFWLLMLNSVILAFTALAEARFMVDIAELKGFERSRGSLLISIIGISNFFGALSAGLSKMICKLSSAAHMVYLLLLIMVPHTIAVYFDTYVAMVITAVISGICIGNIYAHVAVALYELYGTEDYAPAFATWNVLKGVGNFLGGSLGGLIQDKTGSYDLLFRICIVLSFFYAVSFAGICFFRARKKKTYEPLD